MALGFETPIPRFPFLRPWRASHLAPLCALQGYRVGGFVANPAIPFKPVPNKKALLIGINYGRSSAGPQGELNGPQKDVEKMRDLLTGVYRYRRESIVVLTDKDGVADKHMPTHENIMRELHDFFEGQNPGDQYTFLFAGHASQISCDDPNERDGKDELIITSDDKTILDNLLYDYLVKGLLPGSSLTAIFDSCHSGTLLDLPHDKCNRVYRFTSNGRRSLRRVLEPVFTEGSNNSTHVLQSVLTTHFFPDQFCSGYCPRLLETSPVPHVICISACKDHQQSYETEDGDSITSIIVGNLRRTPHPTLKKLMRIISDGSETSNGRHIRRHSEYVRELERHRRKWGLTSSPPTIRPELMYKSDPQLSSLRPLRMNSYFDL